MAALFTVTRMPNPKFQPPVKPGEVDWANRPYFTGVPQGAPTSGALCNLIADRRLDRHIFPALERWNTVHGLEGPARWVYTRYADDLTFSCGKKLNDRERGEFMKDIVTIARRAGYEINGKKTRYSQNGKRRSLLGMTFNQLPNYRADKYGSLRCLTHNCAKHGFESQFERAGFGSAAELTDWLRGMLNWVNQINPEKGAKLLTMFRTASELQITEPVTGLTEAK
jgi:hypothetical protein